MDWMLKAVVEAYIKGLPQQLPVGAEEKEKIPSSTVSKAAGI
jgi:hypothetical protein